MTDPRLVDALRNAKPPKIVRSVGDLNRVTADGKVFTREKFIYIPNMGVVNCAPYDNHFIFRDLRHKGWTLFCSCGAPAIVVGYDAYKKDGSNQGQLVVCMFHSSNNRHSDGSS